MRKILLQENKSGRGRFLGIKEMNGSFDREGHVLEEKGSTKRSYRKHILDFADCPA